MGYTHYWRRPEQLDKELFRKAMLDCIKVCNEIKVSISFEYNEIDKKPVFTKDLIRFNGQGEYGHETFYLPAFLKRRNSGSAFTNTKDFVFAFCKTAYKPYDLVVTACLIVFKNYFKDNFIVSSDGNDSDWQEAKEICHKVLGISKLQRILEED